MTSWKKQVRKAGKKILRDKSIKRIKLAYTGKHRNSQIEWYAIRNPARTMFTAAIFQILRKLPPCELKNSIYRVFGMKIGKDVAIAYNVFPDPLYPELITIEDGVLIGSDVELATHEFTNKWFSLGRLHIKKDVMVGAYLLMRNGVTIGNNAVFGTYSYISKDVGDWEFVGGIPAKFIKKLTPEDLAPKQDIEITR